MSRIEGRPAADDGGDLSAADLQWLQDFVVPVPGPDDLPRIKEAIQVEVLHESMRRALATSPPSAECLRRIRSSIRLELGAQPPVVAIPPSRRAVTRPFHVTWLPFAVAAALVLLVGRGLLMPPPAGRLRENAGWESDRVTSLYQRFEADRLAILDLEGEFTELVSILTRPDSGELDSLALDELNGDVETLFHNVEG